MAYKTISIIDDGSIQKEAMADGTGIYPGYLLALSSTAGDVTVHGDAGQNAQRMFAIEDSIQGQEIGDVYSNNTNVLYKVFQRGNEILAMLATSQTIAIGDMLESAGDGTLRVHSADSAGAVEYPECIVVQAMEDGTTTSAVARIRVEIL